MRPRFAAWIVLFLPLVAARAQEPQFELEWGSHGTADGQFAIINGIHVASDGLVWVADLHAVQSFDGRGTFLARWDYSNTGWITGPSDVAVTANGDILVSDRFNDSVSLSSSSGVILKSTSLCPETHFCPVALWTIEIDSQGFFLVGVHRLGQVVKLNHDLEVLSIWGGFRQPDGIAINDMDQVFVADSQQHRVKKLDATGAVLCAWGEQGSGLGQFDGPCGVAVDPQGVVYVVDRNNHRIQAFDSCGTFLFAWGSEGSDPGHFRFPSAIDIGQDGSIFIGDADNYRIQKFSRVVAVNKHSWGAVKNLYR